jgi:RNA polymerase-binding transcription factor DksA
MAKKEKPKTPVSNKSTSKPKSKGAAKPAHAQSKLEAKHSTPAKPAASPKQTAPAKVATKLTAKPAASKPEAPAKAAPTPTSKVPTKGVKATPVVIPVEKVAKQSDDQPSKKNALRESILARKAALKPIAYTLEEVRAIALSNFSKEEVSQEVKTEKVTNKPSQAKIQELLVQQNKPSFVQAASLADILGFNPKVEAKRTELKPVEEVPEKYRKFYRLLIDMRQKLTEDIELHSEESLKRSAKEDSGDLSAYGQNMSDGGLNTFDRDFVLSLVSSEQEALSEIDAAIKRIHDGTYGICETTGKPIPKDRLMAVPFTRHCAEAKKNIEKNHYRARTQPGLFGEMGEEGGSMLTEDSGGDE